MVAGLLQAQLAALVLECFLQCGEVIPVLMGGELCDVMAVQLLEVLESVNRDYL